MTLCLPLIQTTKKGISAKAPIAINYTSTLLSIATSQESEAGANTKRQAGGRAAQGPRLTFVRV